MANKRHRRASTKAKSAPRHQPVKEIIGRQDLTFGQVAALGLYNTSVDTTTPDYAFWDGVRSGTKPDYQLGGLFAEPMGQILSSWTFGERLDAEVEGDPNDANVAYTNAEISSFLNNNLMTLIQADESSLGLGDSYIVVNADGSLTAVAPHEVEILTTPLGSLNVTGYRITSKLPTQTIIDEYTLKGRTRTVKAGDDKTVEEYPNLIGALPVIHFPTKRGVNELHGRPYFARQRHLFARYDKVLNKTLDGVELLGNPKPSIQGVEDPEATIRNIATGTAQVTNPRTGDITDKPVVDFSKIPMMVIGKGGRFEFVGPATGFTGDAEKTLGVLFLLMLQNSGIPEWVWGGAIASSNASVDAQLPAFEHLIQGLRMKRERPIVDLLAVWMLYRALYDPRIVLSRPRLRWQPVVAQDKRLMLERLKFATAQGYLTDETALGLTDLVEDPDAEVKAAREQQAANAPPDQQVDNAINDYLNTT